MSALIERHQFVCEKGQLVGVVGISGCGKSTLKILSGNILPSHGSVRVKFSGEAEHLYPGTDGNGLSMYRELTSIVSQDSHVFSETLRQHYDGNGENSKPVH